MRSMKRVLRLTALLTSLTALLFSADLTGKWKGMFGGADQDRELTFDLAAKGETLSGTVSGLLDHPLEIKEGKVQGDAVTFWIQSEFQGQPVKLICKGQVKGSEIRFNVGNEEGSWSTEMAVKRAS
jgi:hypothetical protein